MEQEFYAKSLVKLESNDRFYMEIKEDGHMFLSIGKKGSNNYWSGDENNILDFIIRLDNLVEIPDLSDNEEFDYSNSYNEQFMYSSYEREKFDFVNDQLELRDDFIDEFNNKNIDLKSISNYILESIKNGDGLYELTGGDEIWKNMISDVLDILNPYEGIEFDNYYEGIQNDIITSLYGSLYIYDFEKLDEFLEPYNFSEDQPIITKDDEWDERLFEQGTHYIFCPKAYEFFSSYYRPSLSEYFNDFKKFYLCEPPYNKIEYKDENYQYGEYRKVITKFLISDNPTIEGLFSLIHRLRHDYLSNPEECSPLKYYILEHYSKLEGEKAKKLYYKYVKRNRDFINKAINDKDKEKIQEIVKMALSLTDDQLEFVQKFLGYEDSDQLLEEYYDEYRFTS